MGLCPVRPKAPRPYPAKEQQFAKIAVEPVGGSIAETTKFLAAERAKWRSVIQSANISVE
jgi:hypothetical protein